MRRIIAVLTLFLGLIAVAWAADRRVDLELVLLADASRSIDDVEIRLQRQGYAAAITHPQVLKAITGGYRQRIAVTYVEWGDETSQEVVVPWQIVDGPASAAKFAAKLMARPRLAHGPNAIGNAIVAAHALIEANDIAGDRRVIDFSGDSAWSWGGVPIEQARAMAIADDIVINGLAILCRDCSGRPVSYDLEAAYAELIIGGPGAFVVTADGDDRFAEAVRRKLVLEIAGGQPGPARTVVNADIARQTIR
ncbi:MAG: DUF1194 domain-containing protein [Alphaproteobacteria bacterium]|nr:DUF1194 domain-containing protein [Alphaproteobacteria bacterium]MDP6566386.1 DUF1194 domain-containing protein [Alphaproteobacteria bacterium]MDP6812823.1 DUF1194 domain-containing protein [Alphaproteobacteria bacterium]